MPLALCSISPPEVIRLFSGSKLILPYAVVEPVEAGWSDDNYRVLDVVPFSIPVGKRTVEGAPRSYLIDGDVVRESLAVEDIPEAPAVSLADLARDALAATDSVALRCFKAGVAFPDAWRVYVGQLREIVRTSSGEMPKRPAYPDET